MSEESTEVYLCKAGQKLRNGRLVFAPHVVNREDARADARERIREDPKLAKIAYYRIDGEGNHRNIFTFTNKNLMTKEPPKQDPLPPRKKRRRKRTLWGRIKASLGF